MLRSICWCIRGCLISILFVQAALLCKAQSTVLNGHVSDASHAVIQNARILVVPGDIVVTSNEQGDFTVPSLAPGSYTVTISASGLPSISKLIRCTSEESYCDALLPCRPFSGHGKP